MSELTIYRLAIMQGWEGRGLPALRSSAVEHLDLNIPLSNSGHIGVSVVAGRAAFGFAEIRNLSLSLLESHE